MDTIGVNLFVSSIGTFADHSNHYLMNGITRLFKTLFNGKCHRVNRSEYGSFNILKCLYDGI